MFSLRPTESQIQILLVVGRLHTHGKTATLVGDHIRFQFFTRDDFITHIANDFLMAFNAADPGLEWVRPVMIIVTQHPLNRSLSRIEEVHLARRYVTPIEQSCSRSVCHVGHGIYRWHYAFRRGGFFGRFLFSEGLPLRRQ